MGARKKDNIWGFTVKGDESRTPMSPNAFDERLDNAVEAWPWVVGYRCLGSLKCAKGVCENA